MGDVDNYCKQCRISFKNSQGLLFHYQRDYFHKIPGKSDDNTNLNVKNKRLLVPYEHQSENINKLQKIEPSKPQYIDLDQLKILIQSKSNNNHPDDNYNDIYDDHDYNDDNGDDDEEEEEEDEDDNIDEEKKGWLVTIDNMQVHPNIHPHHPDLNPGPIMACLKHQLDLYSSIYGLKAIDSINIEEFKAGLKIFEKSKMTRMKCYLFAKRNNISRNGGNDMLKLIRSISPSTNDKELPTSWKTVTRLIDNQTKFYKCFKMTIPFPSHWEMDKWDCDNSPRPQEVVIRIRDLLEVIAEQCVNPKIHLLWKEHVHINCYKKTNEKGEIVYSDLMTSPWAHAEQKNIERINPKGLVAPVIFYVDGVSPGMSGKTHITPIMLVLGFYDEELRKQNFCKTCWPLLKSLQIFPMKH
jgi:hypothetical protein